VQRVTVTKPFAGRSSSRQPGDRNAAGPGKPIDRRLRYAKGVGAIMNQAKTIVVYSDYKSPYAFLAKDLI
jgi:hypothetical protein